MSDLVGDSLTRARVLQRSWWSRRGTWREAVVAASRFRLGMMTRRRRVGIAGQPPQGVVGGETCYVYTGCSTAPQPFVSVFHFQLVLPLVVTVKPSSIVGTGQAFKTLRWERALGRSENSWRASDLWHKPSAGAFQANTHKTTRSFWGVVTDQIQQRMTVRMSQLSR